MFESLSISTSGLTAQRTRMDVIAGNIALADATRDAAGRANPYRRRIALFAPADVTGHGAGGVTVERIVEDPSDFKLVYQPGHPDAIRSGPHSGYVRYPNVDLAMEYVDAIEAARSYEANLAAFEVGKSMLINSLRLLA